MLKWGGILLKKNTVDEWLNILWAIADVTFMEIVTSSNTIAFFSYFFSICFLPGSWWNWNVPGLSHTAI